jgi:RNA recognition motif-containing protein
MALLLRTIPCSTQLSTKQHFDFENKKHSSTNPFFSSSSFHSPLRLSISHHTPTTTLIRTKQHSNSTLRFTSISEQLTTQEQQQDTEEQKEEEVSPTRLLVQNIPFTSTAEDLRTLFEKYGKVVDIEV